MRALLEDTLFNLIYDMDHIGEEADIREGLAVLSDLELETLINDYLETI